MSNFKVLGFTLTVLLVLTVCLQGNVSAIATPDIVVDVYIGPLLIKAGDNDAGPVFPLYGLTKDFIGTLVINSTSKHLATFIFTSGPYNGSELIVKGKGNEIANCLAVLILGDTGMIVGGTGTFSCASGSVGLTPGMGPTHLDEATITYETAC